MAYIAACTDKGAKRRTNQDACCVQVAETPFGELLMAIVCDGVGGLAAGELASSTVAYRFAQWFNEELPVLVDSMSLAEPFNFDMVEMVWGVLLANLNDPCVSRSCPPYSSRNSAQFCPSASAAALWQRAISAFPGKNTSVVCQMLLR